MRKPKKQKLFDPSVVSTEILEAMRHDLGSISNRSEYTALFAQAQSEKLLKKFISKPDSEIDEKAYSKFLEANRDMQTLSYDCMWDRPSTSNASYRAFVVLRMASQLCHEILGDGDDVDEVAIIMSARHSGGVSAGIPFLDTSLERKWKFPITSTAEAARYFPIFQQTYPELWEAIRRLNWDNPYQEPLTIVEGSKLCTVPKTNEISRTISPEPTFNMYLQQGLAQLIWDKIERWGLSLSKDQEKHRSLAFKGSITNVLGTIDFESASDRVSWQLVQLLFPRVWSAAIADTRCSKILVKDEWVTMFGVSTMGNATTFPVETLVLWSLAIASQLVKTGDLTLTKRAVSQSGCHTFGDDVIMPASSVDLFLETTKRLRMVPNIAKSYWNKEYFRESCGGDFFHGRDVRVFYLRTMPEGQSKSK